MMKKSQKTDGYSYIETLIAIALLTIMTSTLIPSLIRLNQKAQNHMIITREMARVQNLTKLMIFSTENIHWSFYSRPPQYTRNENGFRIDWNNGEECFLEVIREDENIRVATNKNEAVFRLNSLKTLETEEQEYGISLHLSSDYFDYTLPLHYGSREIVLHE